MLLDIFLHIFHTGFIMLVLVGWIFPPTRILNLLAIVSAVFCWVIIGFFKGFGYCPIVDVHNKVRVASGRQPFQHRYIKHIIDFLTNFDFNDEKVDRITYFGFAIVVIMSFIVNVTSYIYK